MTSAAKWVEEENTEGAGDRWLGKLEDTLNHMAHIGIKHAICKNRGLARYGQRCFAYNEKWVIAYKIHGDKFVVYRFILGAKLK